MNCGGSSSIGPIGMGDARFVDIDNCTGVNIPCRCKVGFITLECNSEPSGVWDETIISNNVFYVPVKSLSKWKWLWWR